MNKSVLDYKDEELTLLSTTELQELLKEASDGESLYNTQQMAAKLSINSLN